MREGPTHADSTVAADQVCDFFVNPAPVSYGEYFDEPAVSIDGIDDSETADPIFPESFEQAEQRFPRFGFRTEASHCGSDAVLHVRRKMPDYSGDMRRYLQPISDHFRPRFLFRRGNSSNTSSKDRPGLPAPKNSRLCWI